jgi:hypothetical protein
VELLLIARALALDCPSPAAALDVAERSVLYADLDACGSALAQVELAFACGPPAEARDLTRFWLVEGAYYLDKGDVAGAGLAFGGARRLAPGVWIEALGPERRAAYDAPLPSGVGTIVVDADPGGTTWIDGVVVSPPVVVAVGEHLVQHGAEGQPRYACLVSISAGQNHHVLVPAVEPSPAPAPAPAPPAPLRVAEPVVIATAPAPLPRVRPYAHLAVGADLVFGGSFDDLFHARATDPVTAVLLPLEAGGGVDGVHWWVRAVGSVAPAVRGALPYTDEGGDPASAGTALGGHLAAGGSIGPLDIGLSGGAVWPGRLTARFLLGFTIPGVPIELELRAGINRTAEAGLEPAAGVVLAFPGTAR